MGNGVQSKEEYGVYVINVNFLNNSMQIEQTNANYLPASRNLSIPGGIDSDISIQG